MTESVPQRAKSTVVIAAAVAFFLAASTFATLWTAEKIGHSTTNDQLGGARTRADQLRAKAADADEKITIGEAELLIPQWRMAALETNQAFVTKAKELVKTMDSGQKVDVAAAYTSMRGMCKVR